MADVGQLFDVTKHERFHGHGQKCGRRTGPRPSPKFRTVLAQRLLGLVLRHSYVSDHTTGPT